MSAPVRVLSIDGGGIRGVIPARLIGELETRAGRPVSSMFDLIAGTSTGGLLALILALPQPGTDAPRPAQELVKLYELHGARIFPPSLGRKLKITRASHEPLAGVVEQYAGDASLSDTLTNVLVPAYEIQRRQPFFFKSWKAADNDAWDFNAVDAALATCSAPTYFDPWTAKPSGG